uniref:Uncharacterized protein n=1 Tax=Opuntia streptacantha TaxID=393608 RepID=A0A7C9EPN4_OPUST
MKPTAGFPSATSLRILRNGSETAMHSSTDFQNSLSSRMAEQDKLCGLFTPIEIAEYSGLLNICFNLGLCLNSACRQRKLETDFVMPVLITSCPAVNVFISSSTVVLL